MEILIKINTGKSERIKMKKIILVALVLLGISVPVAGVSEVDTNEESVIRPVCTVNVPSQCLEILDSSSSYYFPFEKIGKLGDQDRLAYIPFIVEVKCLVSSKEDPAIMAPPEYKVFLAVHKFEVEWVPRTDDFFPTILPIYISFKKNTSEYNQKASLTCEH